MLARLARRGAPVLLAALLCAPGCKDDEAEAAEPAAEASTDGSDPAATTPDVKAPPPKPPRPGQRVDLQGLTFGEVTGWTGRYDTFLQSWTFEKTSGEGDARQVSRFYVGHMPATAPTAVDHYASQLRHSPEFQDVGYVYTEVTDKVVHADGWEILGQERDTADPKSEATTSFVSYRDLGTAQIRCRGGRFADPKHLDEARTLCRAARF